MGPTACGKTDLAIALHQHIPCDIISVDSTMVYKGLDIGTAKPTPDQLAKAPHRLIDICDPTEPYSVAQFCEDARQAIDDSLKRGRTPVLVGGTILYFHALQQGLSTLPPSNKHVRHRLQEQMRIAGPVTLYQQLKKVDPVSAGRIQPQDRQRFLRALEVYDITGQPLSYLWETSKQKAPPLPTPVHTIILWPSDRQALRQRIAQRLDHLLEQGFIEEVQGLKKQPGMHADLPSMRAIGYRQIWDYLDKGYDQAVLYEKIYTATCQFAKRQLTWLRREWPNEKRFEITFDAMDDDKLPKGLLAQVLS